MLVNPNPSSLMKPYLAVLLCCLVPSAGAVTITPIALSGQTAPGLGGARFATNSPFTCCPDVFATINNEGRVAFRVRLQVGESGVTESSAFTVWHGTPTNLQLMARSGTTEAFSFSGFSGMDDQGRVALLAFLNEPFGADEVIYRSRTNGALQEIAREGGFIFPDKFFGNGGNLLQGAFSVPQLTTEGRVVFVSQFTGTDVTQFNDSALFVLANPPALSFSMREGDVLQSAQDGSIIAPAPQGAANYGFSASPNVVYVSTLIKTPANELEVAMVGVSPANADLINRTSFTAPGTGLAYESFSTPTSCKSGVFYLGSLVGGGTLLLFQTAPGLGQTIITRSGNPAPGTPAHFSTFAYLTAAGSHLTFRATLTGSGVTSSNSTGIWAKSPGSPLRLVMRQGDPAPEMPPGVVFGSGFSPSPTAINARGQIVFSTSFSGVSTNEFPATQSSVHAVYASEPDGQLRLLVRAGQQVQVANNDTRTIRRVGPVGTAFAVGEVSGSDNGRPSIFNDRGQLLLTLEFTEGTTGLFLVATDVISEFTFTPGQPARATVGTIAGATYGLERNATLASLNWSNVTSAVGTGLPLTLEDPAPGGDMGFYRVRVQQP